ncbi:MAG: tryptophan synthase subunit alpha [Planctomycetota bacterium]
MSKIDELFSSLKSSGGKAFMPFITAGDPDLEFTAALLRKLDQAGCHLVELGIPYSDPIADGPVIQASYTRALNGGVQIDAIFEMLSSVTPDLTMPVVTMVSFSIIHRIGVDEYLKRATAAGVSGAIVPDLPFDEATDLEASCKAADFSLIHLITPTTSQERLNQIAERSTGFIYYVSVTGITGERKQLPDGLISSLEKLRDLTETPVCVGFGISAPEHVDVLKPVADGIIVGSAIVKRIAAIETGSDKEQVTGDVISFAEEMIAAAN